MAQKLTVIRIDADWYVRDVTGALYGKTAVLADAIATAEALAKRIGAQVILSDEAKNDTAAGAELAESPIEERKASQWRKRKMKLRFLLERGFRR